MKKVLNLVVALVLMLSCALCLTACGAKLPGTKTEGVLVVGMECDYAPFNWTETKPTATNVPIANLEGSYAEGYDVQMAKKIADGLGYELQIKALVWDGLIPALKNGEIDMIIAGMSPTDERKKSISFSDGYYASTHVMLMNADSKYMSAKSLEEFKDAKVAGQLGTIFADLVPQATAKGAVAGTNLETVPLLVNEIKNKTLDATIVEKPVALGLVAADSTLGFVDFEKGKGFEVAEEDVTVSVGVRKECEFIDKINTILAGTSSADRDALMTAAVVANAA